MRNAGPRVADLAFRPSARRARAHRLPHEPMASSKVSIYGAIAANVAIAIIKFVVAGITGSSAMLSEGIHSIVDTGNGVLLLVGVRLSQRPPTPEHPFGHGKELYFWSLIVAVLIFGVGGGLSLYEGVTHMRTPSELADPTWNYVVLACAALFEGSSLAIALRQFKIEAGGRPFWQSLHSSKDPTTYTVLAEDSAALAGLAVAAVSVWASHHFHDPGLDGVGSIVIGLLLCGVAVVLIHESRGLLVGEGIRRDTAQAISELVRSQPGVRDVGPLLSMYMGPDEAVLVFDVELDPRASASDAANTVERLEREIRGRWPKLKRIYIESRRGVGDREAANLVAQP
jgi:cation diffusion facilitator family transporter